MILEDSAEDLVWKTIDANDIWVLDKLILSRKLGYTCGPVGLDVPMPNYYIVRPCVNMLGLGLGAQKVWIDKDTTTLPLGYFWCEWFEGKHLSVDYNNGLQKLCVEGIKEEDTFTKWSEWKRVNDQVQCPIILNSIIPRYNWINCEFIDGNLIEVHLRHNEDFDGDIQHFIPVWHGEDTTPPVGFKYRNYPDLHGRIGAFIK
jgi:hypothetical protein